MIDVLPYVAKSVISFGVFYSFFFIFLQKEASLKFNRFYLLGTAIFSLLIPFLTINLTSFGLGPTSHSTASTYYVVSGAVAPMMESAAQTSHFNWAQLAIYCTIGIYLIGVLVMLFRFLTNISVVVRNVWSGEKVKHQRLTLVLNRKEIAPHTFLKYIFLNKHSFQSREISNEVIEHEKAHVEQLHSIDILVIELIKIIFWFNPFIWMYKKDIQLNHEYLADQAVLKETPIIEYQTAILKTIELTNNTNLVSNFTYSSIKKRFIMMTKTKTKTKAMMIKLGLLVPLTLAVFLVSVNLQAQEAPETKVEKVVKVIKDDDGKTTKTGEKKAIKVEVKREGNGALSKKEIADIKKEVERKIQENKELTEKEKEELKREMKSLEKDLESMLIDKENLDKEKIKVIKIKKELEKEHDGKKMIFISNEGDDIEVIDLGSEQNNGSQNKVIISNSGSKVKVISTDHEDDSSDGKTIWVESNGNAKVKVIKIDSEDAYEYEWNSESESNIDIDIEKIIESATKNVEVIVNGETIEIDNIGDIDDLDKIIKIELDGAMKELDGAMEELDDAMKEMGKDFRIISIETEDTKSSKKKNRKRR